MKRRPSNHPGRHSAFTLVEAMVCLLLVASLAAVAAVNLRAGKGNASLEAAVVELQSADRLMRDRSRRHGHAGQLVFDMNGGTVSRVEQVDDKIRRLPLSAFGDGTRVRAIRATAGEAEDGVYAIRCRDGRTPSYAVLVATADQQQWLIVAGLTGQIEKAKNDAEVAKIFSDLSVISAETSRDDAR